ncbi:MAG: hypothetical protein IT447_04925 [Phycisphaerales bacterium]|nr:hypothetical protein [Phycisphaerales bacterium]
MEDSCWQKSKEVGGFTQLGSARISSDSPTFVRGVYDQQKLYLFFRCVQPRTQPPAKHLRDEAIWFDDCVELFLSPHITTTLMQTRPPDDQHFHLVVNSAGDQFDELGSGGPASWDGQWEAKTLVTPQGWQAEIAIPFASLYFENFETRKNPPELTSWRVQFGRTTSADGAHWSLFPAQGMFKFHQNFGDLVFVSDPSDRTIRWKLDEQQRIRPRVEKIESALRQMESADDPHIIRMMKDRWQDLVNFKRDFASLQHTEYASIARGTILDRLDRLERGVLDIQALAVMQKARRRGDQVAIGAHPPIKDQLRIFPDSVPSLESIGRPVAVAACPQEYEAASFVIWNERPVSNLMVEIGPMQGDGGTLPAEAIDIRWVKCWYQAGDSDIVPVGRVLIPELLLKNPEMVTVDRVHEKNILLDGYNGDPSGRGYRDDSKSLLPIRQVEAKTSTQVWLTIHVPAGTKAGVYSGTITVKSGDDPIAKLPIELQVLDFTLERSPLENNWYAQTMWGTMDERRALAEMRNLIAHGVDYVGLFELRENLPKVLRLMKKAGMATDKVYIQPHRDSTISLEWTTPQSAAEMARLWKEAAQSAGTETDQVYLYLIDEARDAVLKAERPLAEAIRQQGVKTWVACYSNYFDIGGEFIDLANIAHGPVASELVRKIHAAGKRVFCYANPQGGVERPEVYRRNYGLLLWQADYDGSFDWSWYWQFGPTVNPNGWDDFNHRVYRDHMMVYATKNNVVDTIQWEGWREGVDDTRYVATLIREIAAARRRGKTTTANAAQAYLDKLKSGGPSELLDLDLVRSQIIGQIQLCRKAR